ncbi:M23 family metallopeptidase [Alicyclobacillus curvatus]|jgi:stage II sporulation protein Q|nr:M23 family metallopeptidase [Alicyclobacillus curvatus]
MDANKHPQEQNKEEMQATTKPLAKGAAGSRRIFSKRWVYPAIYLGAAALIIGLMYVKSQVGSSPVTSNAVENPSGQATATTEQFQWPAATSVNPKVTLGFFPSKGTQAQQANALVVYDNGYYPHMGYDIQAASKQTFNVEAALSGKVTSVTANPLYGNIVEMTASNGYQLRYESLGSVDVKVGDTVKQGQVIGTSGTCQFEQSQGNHLYFSVYKNGNPVDPGTLLPKL